MRIDNIGDLIKQFMKSKGLTREEFAKECGITERVLRSILEKNELVKVDTLVGVCNVLNITPNYLLRKEFEIDQPSVSSEDYDLDEMRTIVKVVLRKNGDKVRVVKYSVPFTSKDSIAHIDYIHYDEQEYLLDISLPLFGEEGVRMFYFNTDIDSNFRTKIYENLDVSAQFLLCEKVEDIKELEKGVFYITINSLRGMDLSHVEYDEDSSLFNFSLEEDLLVVGYKLPEENVFEIWKIKASINYCKFNDFHGDHNVFRRIE